MKIGIATDHNGVEKKKEIISFLEKINYEVIDFSPNNTDIDDYPDYAKIVCENINNGSIDLGILMCGTGIGMSIAANKYKGIRCAKISNLEEARLAKEHNDANVIALSYKENISILNNFVLTFLNTNFSNQERHIRRINKIRDIENES